MTALEFHRPLRVLTLGEFAREGLAAHPAGTVVAVFRRSFYIQLGAYALCIGPPGIGKGPVNIIIQARDDLEWPELGLVPKQRVAVSRNVIDLASRVRFDFSGADVWRPPQPPRFSRDDLRTGLRLLSVSARRRLPGGLGATLAVSDMLTEWPHSSDDPLLRLARTPIGEVAAWILRALARKDDPPPRSIEQLIGLGPGLTPSGDDFVGGLMVALHYFGFASIAATIAETVLPFAARETNTISAQLLRCAAAGQASSSLFDALDAILTGAGLDARLDVIDAIGHTSGWDSLAGAALVCATLAGLEESILTELR